QMPYPGGPSAVSRLERDVLSLSGVTTVIWLEGINDFSKNGNAMVEAVQAGMKQAVGRIRARIPGVRVIGATLTPAVGANNPPHGPDGVGRPHAARRPSTFALHDPGACPAHLGPLSGRQPARPRTGLAPPPRDRDRSNLRALRLRVRMGCARRVLRPACGPDAGTGPRDGARRWERSRLDRR